MARPLSESGGARKEGLPYSNTGNTVSGRQASWHWAQPPLPQAPPPPPLPPPIPTYMDWRQHPAEAYYQSMRDRINFLERQRFADVLPVSGDFLVGGKFDKFWFFSADKKTHTLIELPGSEPEPSMSCLRKTRTLNELPILNPHLH